MDEAVLYVLCALFNGKAVLFGLGNVLSVEFLSCIVVFRIYYFRLNYRVFSYDVFIHLTLNQICKRNVDLLRLNK